MQIGNRAILRCRSFITFVTIYTCVTDRRHTHNGIWRMLYCNGRLKIAWSCFKSFNRRFCIPELHCLITDNLVQAAAAAAEVRRDRRRRCTATSC